MPTVFVSFDGEIIDDGLKEISSLAQCWMIFAILVECRGIIEVLQNHSLPRKSSRANKLSERVPLLLLVDRPLKWHQFELFRVD